VVPAVSCVSWAITSTQAINITTLIAMEVGMATTLLAVSCLSVLKSF